MTGLFVPRTKVYPISSVSGALVMPIFGINTQNVGSEQFRISTITKHLRLGIGEFCIVREHDVLKDFGSRTNRKWIFRNLRQCHKVFFCRSESPRQISVGDAANFIKHFKVWLQNNLVFIIVHQRPDFIEANLPVISRNLVAIKCDVYITIAGLTFAHYLLPNQLSFAGDAYLLRIEDKKLAGTPTAAAKTVS